MMAMYFTFAPNIKNFLFKGWNIETHASLAVACIIFALGAALLHFVRTLLKARLDSAARHAARQNTSFPHPSPPPTHTSSTPLSPSKSGSCHYSGSSSGAAHSSAATTLGASLNVHPQLTPSPPALRAPWAYQLARAAFHVIHVGIGYIVMLAVMSYNGWIFLATLFGFFLSAHFTDSM